MARVTALVVVAVLVLAAIVFLFPGASPVAPAHAAPAPAAAHPAATMFIEPLDQNGFYTTYFTVALGATVNFYVSESSGDTNATVTLTDQNATRDGLTNPVATWTVNITSGSNDSYLTGGGYALPLTLTYGGWWNLTASGALGGNYTTSFEVATYQVSGQAAPYDVLPGYAGQVAFLVVSTVNEAPYTHASVAITAVYLDATTGLYAPLALTNTSFATGTATGWTSYTMPLNASAYSYVYFTLYANTTVGGNFSAVNDAYAFVAQFYDVGFSVGCTSCYGDTILEGSPVTLTVTAYYSTGGSGIVLPGDWVGFGFTNANGTAPVSSVPGAPPAHLLTNSEGQASILFIANAPPFSSGSATYNQVNISVLVSPAGPNNVTAVWDNFTWGFYVELPSAALPAVQITFGHAQYFGGDSLTAAWSLVAQNTTALVGWTGSAYYISTSGSNSQIVATGLLTGSSGSITYAVPLSYTGYLYVEVLASNATMAVYGEYDVDVYSPSIILLPSEYTYNGGDTVTVQVSTLGSVVNGSALYFQVTAPALGTVIASGMVSGNSFQFTVPSSQVPTYVEVSVNAQNPTLGLVASDYTYIDQKVGYSLTVGISTASTYSDGSYQPGQSLTVTWSLSSFGPVVPPKFWYVSLWDWNGEWGDAPPIAEIVTSAMSGSFSYQIPSGASSGIQTLYVEVNLDTAPCSGTSCYAFGQVSFLINPSPGSLNGLVGGSGGVSVGWLLLLVIVLVVAVLLIVLVLRRGRRPPAAAPASTMNPPAPPPSSPPPSEWKSPSSDADRPAMPAPPPGAQ